MNYLIVEDLTCELGRIDPGAVCHPFTEKELQSRTRAVILKTVSRV